MSYLNREYSEVCGVLEVLGNKYIDKIPKDYYEYIVKHKDNNYTPKYSGYFSFSEQGVSKNALSIIAYLHYNYWCATEEEKNRLKKIFDNNFKENVVEKSKLESNNVFRENLELWKKSRITETKKEEINHQAIVKVSHKEKGIFGKLVNWFRNIFYKG